MILVNRLKRLCRMLFHSKCLNKIDDLYFKSVSLKKEIDRLTQERDSLLTDIHESKAVFNYTVKDLESQIEKLKTKRSYKRRTTSDTVPVKKSSKIYHF